MARFCGLLNARVRYLRFAFAKKPVTSLRRFYAIMFTFFLLIWSIAEYNSPLPRVCIDRKKSVTSHMTWSGHICRLRKSLWRHWGEFMAWCSHFSLIWSIA